jgi:hypothetical protein
MRSTLLSSFTAASIVLVLAAGPTTAGTFRRGDANGDGSVGVGDPIATVHFLFQGQSSLSCLDAADSDDSGSIDITDAIFSLSYLFLGGATIPAPGTLQCGVDPSPDSLGACVSSTCDEEPIDAGSFTPSRLGLPEYRGDEVGAAIVRGRIEEAILLSLNSIGDSITIDLEAGVSVPIVPGVPVNASMRHEASVTVSEQGGYDVSIAFEVALGIGVELVDGIEAEISNSAETRLVFHFADVESTVAAVQSLAVAQLLVPLADGATDVINGFDSAAAALAGALSDLGSSRELERVRAAALAAALATERSLQASIDAARAQIRDIDRRIGSLENTLADLIHDVGCRLLGLCDEANAVRRTLSQLSATRRSLFARVDRLGGELRDAVRVRELAKVALDAARDVVRSLESAVESLRGEIERLRVAVDRARDVLDRIGSTRLDFEARLHAVEITLGRGASVEAFLSPFPGVSLAGAGVGASASNDLDMSALLILSREGGVSDLELSIRSSTALDAQAALGVGVRAGAEIGLSSTLGFHWNGTKFDGVTGNLLLDLDAWAVAVLGVGATLEHGAGRHLELEFDLAQVRPVATALWNAVGSGDTGALIGALADLEVTFRAQDRWITAFVIDAGGSYLGFGAEARGSLAGDDLGVEFEEIIDAAEIVESLFSQEAVRDLVLLLDRGVSADRL